MKIIHLNGYSEQERLDCRNAIRFHALTCIKALLEAAAAFNYKLSEENEKIAQSLLDVNAVTFFDLEKIWQPELGADIKKVWKDEAIQKAYNRRHEFQLLDSAK